MSQNALTAADISLINSANGKKGGRPKGVRTIAAHKARAYFAENIGPYMPMIFSALVDKAKTGDVAAVKELFDRAFGKAFQQMDFTTKGESINNTTTLNVIKMSAEFDEFFKEKNK